jgi:hypothetical protein
MQFLSVKPKKIDLKEFRNRSAGEGDCSALVTEDTVVTQDGTPIIVYLKNPSKETTVLLKTLERIKYDNSTRTNGLVTSSKIFGYAPRNMIRNLSCRAASLARSQPEENDVLKRFACIAEEQYERVNKQLHERHSAMTRENVKENYRMNGSMFTSGIVNHNNPLKYHYDTGNYVGVWSAMFAVKRDIKGGHLAVPELDMKFECADGSLIMFDGQSLLHGVTPIMKLKADSVRYTVVFYSLKNMWSCETPHDEVEKMRASRSLIEKSKTTKERQKK